MLREHGCPDVTHDLDHSQSSSSPRATGGFGDVYSGALRNGKKVAIKCARLHLQEFDDKLLLKVSTCCSHGGGNHNYVSD
jgi:hypothetical protein